MINFSIPEGAKVLELGGGDNPNPASTINVDVRPGPRVHFVVDFNADDWPISSDEFDVVLSVFCIEHVSWRRVPNFVAQCLRVLKPGGQLALVSPNTEAQMRHILGKPEFDGDEGSMLFGDQDYPENSHRAAFSPVSMTKLLQAAGFENVLVQPYGQLATDMVVTATKPSGVGVVTLKETSEPAPQPARPSVNTASLTSEQRAALFGRKYWDNYQGRGMFYWDFPQNEIIARHVLARKPESVLEIGCGRGYVLKRIQDAELAGTCQGVDISRHCNMTRAMQYVMVRDLLEPWGCSDGSYDLCFSFCFLEHVPEEKLQSLFLEMQRTCRRGLHGVTVNDDGLDPTRCTVRPLAWWKERLPATHEVYAREELESGNLPADYLKGDGKLKLNLGCAWTQFHNGWTNVDVIDVGQFAQANGYNFVRQDVRLGLPQFGTETASLLFSSHMLEHLTYKEGLAFLKECRRVARPDATFRILVPDMQLALASDERLAELGEVNEACANARTRAGKIYALLHENHKAQYDADTLLGVLDEAGWVGEQTWFRVSKCAQMLRETTDMLPCLSLIVEARPK